MNTMQALPTMRSLALPMLLLSYLFSGLQKLRDFAAAKAEVAALSGDGRAAPLAASVIVTQLGGSALLLFGGRWAWSGGLALAAFTLLATWLAHRWWRLPGGPQREHAFNTFWEHIALVGALLFVAIVGATEARP